MYCSKWHLSGKNLVFNDQFFVLLATEQHFDLDACQVKLDGGFRTLRGSPPPKEHNMAVYLIRTEGKCKIINMKNATSVRMASDKMKKKLGLKGNLKPGDMIRASKKNKKSARKRA